MSTKRTSALVLEVNTPIVEAEAMRRCSIVFLLVLTMSNAQQCVWAFGSVLCQSTKLIDLYTGYYNAAYCDDLGMIIDTAHGLYYPAGKSYWELDESLAPLTEMQCFIEDYCRIPLLQVRRSHPLRF